jgi:hypothetical protein
MKQVNVQIARAQGFTIAKQVSPAEVGVLRSIHGSESIKVLSTVSTDRKYDAVQEFDSMVRRYGGDVVAAAVHGFKAAERMEMEWGDQFEVDSSEAPKKRGRPKGV